MSLRSFWGNEYIGGGGVNGKSHLGHSGEHVYKGVQAVLLVLLGEGDHLQTEGQEGAVEETVHQEHLA